jgi:pyruvate/2-oxoglutarate dehydrogenase complex dihydrolipoamide acyltransferase (E2) component
MRPDGMSQGGLAMKDNARWTGAAKRKRGNGWWRALLPVGAAILFAWRQRAGRDGDDYEVKRMPLSRRVIADSGRIGQHKNRILGLIEVDVTEARRRIRAHREQTGESLSFTAFVLACLGKAIDGNKYFHARRDIWGRLVLFDEVDCTTMIEIDLEGHKFPLAHVIRAINKRSLRSIHEEIRAVQANPDSSSSLQMPRWLMTGFLLLPAALRDVLYGFTARMPRLFKRQAGTVMVTAVGMFGAGSGWGIGTGSPYTMSLLLGGIAEKPVLVDGQVAAREFLNITVELDHDIIDGAPASRFASRLKGLLETGYGLEEMGGGR